MNKRLRAGGSICLILLCMGLGFGCASDGVEDLPERQEAMQSPSPKAEQETGKEDQSSREEKTEEDEPEQEEFSPERQLKENKDFFWEEADRQKISRQDGEKCLQILLDDDVFQGGQKKLTGLRIDDIDGNGQVDMLAMVLDAEETPFYGSGGLWFYMNEDEPYCFEEEDCSFYGWFDVFWSDIDNDENIEIVFSAQGTGCGAVGDSYKAVFKYKDHAIERMELPSDFEEDYDQGLYVDLIREPEADRYSAYCPYFDERIFFHGENSMREDTLYEARCVGSNVRGYYDLRVAEYEGKKVLQASEYLNGEGGIAHGVADAKFLITWEEDGTPKVIKWWIEEYENSFANSHESRISYEAGYYYYASQADHYFLYRAREDGSDPVCLAKVHPGSICVQDGEIYFINQSDGNGIYRIKTDGTGMEKLCEKGQKLQISAEYVYFCSTYEAEYDKYGMVTEETSEYDDDFLYRMKKDGSERVLIASDIWQYTLRDRRGSKVMYSGSVYYSKWIDHEFAISRMDLNGENEEEIWRFDQSKVMTVYDDNIYCIDHYPDDEEQISRFTLWDGELTTYKVPSYISRPWECCIYGGFLYTLDEQYGDDGRRISIYRMEPDGTNCEKIYEDSFACRYLQERYISGYVSDLYATEEGVFFRKFVSEEEGCQWFRLTKDEETKEWKAEEWENREKIPAARPAKEIEYGSEHISVTYEIGSTEGYETYLAEDLEYEEYYRIDEAGKEFNPYRIRLPQFNSKIAGYKKINQYFQNAYQEAMKEKENFFFMLAEEKDEPTDSWDQKTDYAYIYIGEDYIMVEKYEAGYWGGARGRPWKAERTVTFDRKSGEVISLGELLGMSEQEAVAKLTGCIYKYAEGIGDGRFFLQESDILAEEYDPEQFFLFPDGIGIYYDVYAIDCGAAGDFIFVVPWEEVSTFS